MCYPSTSSLLSFHCPALPFYMHLMIRHRLQPACAQAVLPLGAPFKGSRSPLFVLLPTMPTSKKKKKTFEQAQDDHWLKETKDRLDQVAERLDNDEDKSGPSEQEWMRAGTMDLEKWRYGEPIATESTTTIRSAEETAELIYRSSNEGLMATGYNPWRHTTYVTGRPVQVHVKSWKTYSQHVCTLRKSILQFLL